MTYVIAAVRLRATVSFRYTRYPTAFAAGDQLRLTEVYSKLVTVSPLGVGTEGPPGNGRGSATSGALPLMAFIRSCI
jgi:hypothetical protein